MRAWIISLDDMIRATEKALRQAEPERLGGLEIDDEFERSGPLNGELTRRRTAQDSCDEICATLMHGGQVGPVRHEPTRVWVRAVQMHGRKSRLERQSGEAPTVSEAERVRQDDERLRRRTPRFLENPVHPVGASQLHVGDADRR